MILYKFKKDPFSSHKRMADYISEEKCHKVLDIGCNRGQLLKALDGWSGEIWGVDKDKEVIAEVNGKYHRAIVMDVTMETVNFKDKFDAIVYGDILEHIGDPPSVIKRFLPCLDKGGIVIISVPNVANWFVRLQLLLGNFSYAGNGILDKTHVRFYTLKTIRKIIGECGLKIEKIKTTPIPLPLLFKAVDYGKPLFFLHVLNYVVTKLRRTLFGYQFVFKCRLKS